MKNDWESLARDALVPGDRMEESLRTELRLSLLWVFQVLESLGGRTTNLCSPSHCHYPKWVIINVPGLLRKAGCHLGDSLRMGPQSIEAQRAPCWKFMII